MAGDRMGVIEYSGKIIRMKKHRQERDQKDE